jgi:hypothetical protein
METIREADFRASPVTSTKKQEFSPNPDSKGERKIPSLATCDEKEVELGKFAEVMQIMISRLIF